MTLPTTPIDNLFGLDKHTNRAPTFPTDWAPQRDVAREEGCGWPGAWPGLARWPILFFEMVSVLPSFRLRVRLHGVVDGLSSFRYRVCKYSRFCVFCTVVCVFTYISKPSSISYFVYRYFGRSTELKGVLCVRSTWTLSTCHIDRSSGLAGVYRQVAGLGLDPSRI